MESSFVPKVSIIIGIHNLSSKWIDAVGSLKSQTCNEWECIICDDGSTDDSYEKLKKLEEKDHRFRIIKNKGNLGLATALNNCIMHAKGKYIARMDDDDISLPQRLEVELNFLENNPNYSFVSSNYYIDNGEKLIKRICIEKPMSNDFLWTSPFLHPATMFRKKSLQVIGGYTEGKITARAEDYDLYMKLYSVGFYGYNIQEFLYKYYVGKKEVGRKSKYRFRIYESIVRVNGFRKLGIPFVRYFPFVIKPLIVGLLPKSLIYNIRTKHNDKNK